MTTLLAASILLLAPDSDPVDVSGEWYIGGTVIRIDQSGTRVRAVFVSIGPNPFGILPGDPAFEGELTGRRIRGTAVSRARTEHAPELRKEGKIELVLNERGTRLKGRFEQWAYDVRKKKWLAPRWRYLSLRREPCREDKKKRREAERRVRKAAAALGELRDRLEDLRRRRESLLRDRDEYVKVKRGLESGADPSRIRPPDSELAGEEVKKLWRARARRSKEFDDRIRELWKRYDAGEIDTRRLQLEMARIQGERKAAHDRFYADLQKLMGARGALEARRRARARAEKVIRDIDASIRHLDRQIEQVKKTRDERKKELSRLEKELDLAERAYRDCLARHKKEECADWWRRFREARRKFQTELERFGSDLQSAGEKVNDWLGRLKSPLQKASSAGDHYLSEYAEVVDFDRLVNLSTDEIEAFLVHVSTVDQIYGIIQLAGLVKALALRAGKGAAAAKLDELIEAASRKSKTFARAARAIERLQELNRAPLRWLGKKLGWNRSPRAPRAIQTDAERWTATSKALENTVKRLQAEGFEGLAVVPSGSAAHVSDFMKTGDAQLLRKVAADPRSPYKGLDSDIDLQLVYKRPDFSKLSGEELVRALKEDRLRQQKIIRIFEEEFRKAAGGTPPSAVDVNVFPNAGYAPGIAGKRWSRGVARLQGLYNLRNPEAYRAPASLWMQALMDKNGAPVLGLGKKGWKTLDSTSETVKSFSGATDRMPSGLEAFGGYVEQALKVRAYAREALQKGADPFIQGRKMAKYYMRAEFMRVLTDPAIRKHIAGSPHWSRALRSMDPHEFIVEFATKNPNLFGPERVRTLLDAWAFKRLPLDHARLHFRNDPNIAKKWIGDAWGHLRAQTPTLEQAARNSLKGTGRKIDWVPVPGVPNHAHALKNFETHLSRLRELQKQAAGVSGENIELARKMADEFYEAMYWRILSSPEAGRLVRESREFQRLKNLNRREFVDRFVDKHLDEFPGFYTDPVQPEILRNLNFARMALEHPGLSLSGSPGFMKKISDYVDWPLAFDLAWYRKRGTLALEGRYIDEMNAIALSHHWPDALRDLGLSDDMVRRISSVRRSARRGSFLMRQIDEIRDLTESIHDPVAYLPYDAVRSVPAFGTLGRLRSEYNDEEESFLTGFLKWAGSKVWNLITSPFRSVAEAVRWFAAGIVGFLYGDELEQALKWLEEDLVEIRDNLGTVRGLCAPVVRGQPEMFDTGPLAEKVGSLKSQDRDEDRLLKEIENELRLQGPDPCLLRLADEMGRWIDRRNRSVKKIEGEYDRFAETVTHLRLAARKMYAMAAESGHAMRAATNLRAGPVQRILDPVVLGAVQKITAHSTYWYRLVDGMTKVTPKQAGGSAGKEGD